MATRSRMRILVGLSGGVDSSVAAARLLREGHEVVGAFIKTWQPEGVPCDWREERRMAMRAAAYLRIPFLTIDLTDVYKREVIDAMLEGYAAGLVPNPDVLCNRSVKFGAFLDAALGRGFHAIATGHYARKRTVRGIHRLFRGTDRTKDQSYFLWMLDQRMLAHALFPVGNLRKDTVRAQAKAIGLPTAEKKESQGLCFIGPLDVHEFLQRELKTVCGPILDEKGRVIGEHDGAALYAIGQRHHLRISKVSTDAPMYVIAKDLARNVLIVAPRSRVSTPQGRDFMHVTLINAHEVYPGALANPRALSAEFRYHGTNVPVASVTLSGDRATFTPAFVPQDLSPGQSVVFYRHDELLGGGVLAFKSSA